MENDIVGTLGNFAVPGFSRVRLLWRRSKQSTAAVQGPGLGLVLYAVKFHVMADDDFLAA